MEGAESRDVGVTQRGVEELYEKIEVAK